MQKAPTRQKKVLIELSWGSHFNLFEKWILIPDTVFDFYFSVAPGLLFAEPRPILLNYVYIQIKKTPAVSVSVKRKTRQTETQEARRNNEVLLVILIAVSSTHQQSNIKYHLSSFGRCRKADY